MGTSQVTFTSLVRLTFAKEVDVTKRRTPLIMYDFMLNPYFGIFRSLLVKFIDQRLQTLQTFSNINRTLTPHFRTKPH